MTAQRCGCLLLALLAPIFSADACDMHARGQFGQFHPLARQHYAQSDYQTLSVSHTRKKSVTTGLTTFIDVQYHVPLRYDAVKLQVSNSEGVSVESSQALMLSQLNGHYRLTFTSLQPGEHTIWLKIAGTLDGQPFTSEQRIDVVSG